MAHSMFVSSAETILKDAFKALEVPYPLKGTVSYSLEEWETVYAAAFGHYEKGIYEEAAGLFNQLILADPYAEKNWRGLAACLQMQKKYSESLHAWAICALLSEEDPLVHFHAAECLISMKEKDEAIKALDSALEKLSQKKEDYSSLRSKIELLKKLHM